LGNHRPKSAAFVVLTRHGAFPRKSSKCRTAPRWKIMAKRKRTPRAKNKLERSYDGTLIKVDSVPNDTPAVVHRVQATAVARPTLLLSAELEAVIDIIARERVYRAMLAGLGRRFLLGPLPAPNEPRRIAD
jgi:hypothetical protein